VKGNKGGESHSYLYKLIKKYGRKKVKEAFYGENND